jgi:transcriptional regulator with XRE-family HTH domain
MSKHSPIDRAYARKFGEKVRDALARARASKNKVSVQAFADSLGVTRAGLHKYRQGKSVPGMDVIEKAKKWKIDVKYGELNTHSLFSQPTSDDKQMLLPLAFDEITADHLQVEVAQKTTEYLQLSVKVFLSPQRRRA